MIKEENLPDGWEIVSFFKYLDLVKSGIKFFNGYKKYIATGSLETSKIIDHVNVTFDSRPSRANMEFEVDDIIFAKMKDTEKVFLIEGNNSDNLYSTGFTGLRINNKDKLLSKYVFYWLISNLFQKEKDKMCSGATQKAINNTKLKQFEIVLPPLETQNKIVEILERAEKLKEWRAEADELNDEFLKSVFLEMFGDPAINPKKWNVIKLKNVYSKNKPGTKCGPFGSALKKHEYSDSGIPVWIMDNIKGNEFIEAGCLYITPEKFNELESYSVEEGDIIISRAGTVGKMCIVSPSTHDSIISTNLIRLSLDQSKVQPIYFISLMTYFKGRVGNLKTGQDGSYTFMNTKVLNDLKIPLPPIELQDQFVEIVKQVKTLKLCQKQSKHKIDNFFNALIQKAFKGELAC